MEGLENIMAILDYTLNTKSKRHIAGGILLSISFLFGGLAITTMTLSLEKEKEINDEE